jgi:hypothetical protein
MVRTVGGRRSWTAGAFAMLLVLAFGSGRAFAAGPAVTTGPTTAVDSSTATVTGTVDPGGQSTTWHVEYGTSTAYGTKTSSVSAGSGSSAVNVSADLSGLQAGTTYHYRIVATNGSGTSHGSDAVFTTAVPPDVVTGTASSIGTSAATLNGTVDPNGRDTTYWFEYGTSTAYGTRSSTQSGGSGTSSKAVSFRLTGLEQGRTFHYRLVARSDAGTTAGDDSTFTTSTAPAVSTGAAASITPTSARLKGSVTPNGRSTTWWFEYGTSSRYGSRSSSHGAGSGRSARSVALTVKKLKGATTYHYRLVARNASGTTRGADRTFSTTGPPVALTAAAQGVGFDSVTLTGTVDTRGRSTTWWFQYGTGTGYGRSTGSHGAGSRPGAQPVSLALTGLTPSTTYHYRLVAKSDAGTTYGPDVAFTTSGVTLELARQVVFGGRIRLSGVVPTRQAGERVTVFSQPYGGGSFRSVATVLTGSGGGWSLLARPGINTAFEARWHGGTTAPVGVGVHPLVTLTRLRNGHFYVRVRAGHLFPRRLVQLQRRVGTHWKTVRQVRLGVRSLAEFKAALPKGRSTLRAAFSVNQAGAGFLGGLSRPLTVTLAH